ncbi:hypothetical protein ACQ4M3_13180 [Leptolyngbya sp. AN03gr2]|uniref:hypothetical protein n=1 Tax=unclassified Leptolyngbya TaxID=2650499 RepID=UPI003D31491B
MAQLHFIDGLKGGVGKSFISTLLIQYCLDKKLPLIAVDADRYCPDVARRYAGFNVQYAVFSEDEKLMFQDEEKNPDRLVELAIM